MGKRNERKEKGEKTRGKKERKKTREAQTDELVFKTWNILMYFPL